MNFKSGIHLSFSGLRSDVSVSFIGVATLNVKLVQNL